MTGNLGKESMKAYGVVNAYIAGEQKEIIKDYYPGLTREMIGEALRFAAAVIGEENVKISFGREYPKIT